MPTMTVKAGAGWHRFMADQGQGNKAGSQLAEQLLGSSFQAMASSSLSLEGATPQKSTGYCFGIGFT